MRLSSQSCQTTRRRCRCDGPILMSTAARRESVERVWGAELVKLAMEDDSEDEAVDEVEAVVVEDESVEDCDGSSDEIAEIDGLSGVRETVTTSVETKGKLESMDNKIPPMSSFSEAVRVNVVVSAGSDDSDAVLVTVTIDCHAVVVPVGCIKGDGDVVSSTKELVRTTSVTVTVGDASFEWPLLFLVTTTRATVTPTTTSTKAMARMILMTRHILRRYHG